MKSILFAMMVPIFGAAVAQTPIGRKGMESERLLGHMLRNNNARVCVDIDVDAEGTMIVSRSSGNKQIDRLALDGVRPNGELEEIAATIAVDLEDGRRRMPLVFTMHEFKKGRVYCPDR